MTILYNTTAIGYGCETYFEASGGLAPYTYEVFNEDGIGGTIDAVSGLYTAPYNTTSDVIKVRDANDVLSVLSISVLSPLELICDIIQKEMGLAVGKVFLWNQKVFSPIDSNIFVVLSEINNKILSNNYSVNTDGTTTSSINTMATISIDIMSKSLEAVKRKEEILFALNSTYSKQQQELNSFHIGIVPKSFNNLSNIDGAAIPYRFNLSVNIQYYIKSIKALPYYDTFTTDTILVNK